MSEEQPDRLYIVFFQSGLRRDYWGMIDRTVLERVRNQIVTENFTPMECEVDLWIESWGGDANAAYKMLLFLRSNFSKIRAIIPDVAKSAATLLAIGCDEIYMAPDAELGPLDVQISHPDRENVPVSGLNVAKSLGYLVDFALDTVTKKGDQLLDATGLTRLEVLRELSRFSSRIVEQVVAKLDPHLLHKAANELEVAQEYARLLLNQRHLGDEENEASLRAAPTASQVAQMLVNKYPAHDFVISSSEARELGLPVRHIGGYDTLAYAHRMHRLWKDGAFDEPSLIRVWSKSDLDQIFRTEDKREDGNGDGKKTNEGDAEGVPAS